MPDPEPAPEHRTERNNEPGAAALVAALVGVALYAVTLGGTYIYDDIYHLFNDWRTQPREVTRVARAPGPGPEPSINGGPQSPQYLPPVIEDPRAWHLYLTQSYNDGIDNLYRPVTSLSYAAQATLHGREQSRAWAWHLFNVLLYAAVCAQVAILAGRMARVDDEETIDSMRREAPDAGQEGEVTPPSATQPARWIALCAGLLFAVHPVHVEVVAGIVGRAELICAAGFLGGLLVLTRPLTPMRMLGFVALMLLSIGAKEQGLVLTAVVLVWYLSRHWAGLPPLMRRVRPPQEVPPVKAEYAHSGALSYAPAGLGGASQDLAKIMFIAVALPLAGYLVLREQVLGLSMAWPKNLLDPTIQPMWDVAGIDRWLMPVALAGRYLALLVLPASLSIDYGSAVIEPPQQLSDPYLWLGFVAVALFAAGVVHAVRSRWVAGLTMLAGFACTYGVASNLPTIIGTVFGERLLFLPSAFFVIWLVMLANRTVVSTGMGGRVAIGLVFVLALAGTARSFTYAVRWNDRVAFYDYQSRVQPRSVRIWMLLGEELRQRGRLQEAAVAAARATDLKPTYWSNWVLRARVAEERGLLEEALDYANRAVESRTDGITTTVRSRIEQAYIRQRDQGETTQPGGEPDPP